MRSPLDNARFRSLLLIVAGIPIAALYVWRTLLLPLAIGALPGDFTENYMAAATKIASGRDPYDLCVIQGCAGSSGGFTPLPLAGAQYVTPLPLAWMLQPLVHASASAQLAVVLAVLQLSLVVFLWTTLRALRVKGWQMPALLVLVAIAFEPVAANFDEGQVNLVLLGLSGIWLLAWMGGDRWWGGAALGAAVAIKLLQAPLGLLVLWGRRWRMLAGAAVAGLVLWLVAVPQYLPEFIFKVAPVLTAGTGLFENHSPGGTIARLLDPATFLGVDRDVSPVARVLTLAVALAVLVTTFWVLRRPSSRRESRGLEAAAMVAAGPLIASYSWGTHLVLLLLPMLVLLDWAIRRRDWLVLALVSGGWMLIGPAHKWFQTLLVSGYSDLLVLRLMAEFGVVGITAIWVASLLAVRRARSADRADAAHENRAEDEEEDRRAEDRTVSGVGRDAVEVVE
ncbi:MAG TPA: glycosyltransferase family 87 protein [Candidatus Dormibacteraeota bacterium]|nr:glycosyltransferase family 87 protein [Candidatus Dormibacteraeota bacterium]